MQEFFLKNKILWNKLKKLTFFISSLVRFNGQSYQKQEVSGTSDQPLFKLRNKFRKIPLFLKYYLTKFTLS